MDFSESIVVVGIGRSSTRELWADVTNNDPPSPASPHCTKRWGLAGDGESLLATPAQSSKVDERPQKGVWYAWSISEQILKFVKNFYQK
jgi:hypothetical protein